MNWDIIKGNWKQMKGHVQSKWGELTDDEIDQAEGDRERLAGLIQERYGVAKDEAERQIDAFIAEHKSAA
ncbi:MAG: CsbD family protein [Pseudomonadota bacterium]